VPDAPVTDGSTDKLVTALQALARAQHPSEIQRAVCAGSRQFTGADGATFALRQGEMCRYVDEDAIARLWKGRGSPLADSASGWVIATGQPLVVADADADDRVGPDDYRATFVRSMVVVPVGTTNPVGAIGVYWSEPHQPTDELVRRLVALADVTAVTMENVAARSNLELRLRDRWIELQVAHDRLAEAIIERRLAEEEAQSQSLTDDLTGLRNRRGFRVLAEQQLRVLRRSGQFGAVIFVDIDDLKTVNDTQGHEAGDRLITTAAHALATTVRESDVAGRVGGDEFAVFLGCDDPAIPELVVGRIQRNADAVGVGVSIGVAVCEPEASATLDELLSTADTAMYRAKKQRRGTTTAKR
jgi:diguanylate cyclase (GGDEF)-like protein